MSHAYAEELKVGLDAVRKASRICRVVQAAITPEVLDKKDNSPVTVADFASQAVVCHAIGEAFPDDPVIAEEDALALHQPENEHFLQEIHRLICDHYRDASHDGTKGFLRRDQYAISLALIVDGQIQIGILACPNLGTRNQSGDSLFYAVLGQGTFALRLDAESEPRRIHVTELNDPTFARFCESFESSHSSHNESATIAEKLGIKAAPVRMDSQAKYAMVAAGEADVYLRLPAKTGYFEKIWDHAGGALIVTEAGGTVTDLQGKNLDFSHGHELRENRGIIVTNGPLHTAVLGTAESVAASLK